ncbi:hypothetical protein C8Q74DRAFT_1277577 [Fomes fomentarius]|nr:hypothetical protein C8Q74DRAFT_1277577 [Fomes fomentarius]
MAADPLVSVFLVLFLASSDPSINAVLPLLKWVSHDRCYRGPNQYSRAASGFEVSHKRYVISTVFPTALTPMDYQISDMDECKVQSGFIARAPGTLTRSLTFANF